MSSAIDKEIIPPDQFAKKCTRADEGTLVKILENDINRAMYTTSAVTSLDLGDCYDRVSHSIASISYQAFGVPTPMTSMMRSWLQTMTFYLRMGFGKSKETYGGSLDDRIMGLGQGSGGAPPGFTGVSTLMIQACQKLGHGLEMQSAWSSMLFKLAAIIFVDDSDLLHRALSQSTTVEDFMHIVQRAINDWGVLCMQ